MKAILLIDHGSVWAEANEMMLSPGEHSTRDIPRMVAKAAAEFPAVSYRVTEAFGVRDKLAEVVLERPGVGTEATA